MNRDIIQIDEEKCDGCGRCVTTCAEGALQIVDGKARLVSDVFCDGLGACIGECPRGALTIQRREADLFDEAAVREHLELAHRTMIAVSQPAQPSATSSQSASPSYVFACPGSAAQVLRKRPAAAAAGIPDGAVPLPELGQWPVQLHLVPARASYFQDAVLLISADCVPVALADFHLELLRGRALVVGCPKLDDVQAYRHKLTQIFCQNDIRMVEIAHMEVPCCYGLIHLVQDALTDSEKSIPLVLIKVGIRGEVLERTQPISAEGMKMS